ncbi:MAG TPA: glycosyltransferase family 2 protein, partial [Anaerolineales bacterium]|nr:glycosyltransferase family 2 protein [Anaerolineales bacterium]
MPPAVSVIIPAYNRASTIARSVESALAQTLQDLEIIVVHDGSTDTTCDVVQGIADERVRLVRHGGNLGAAAARNTGMKASQARYIAWLDSDDEWLPEKLQTQ